MSGAAEKGSGISNNSSGALRATMSASMYTIRRNCICFHSVIFVNDECRSGRPMRNRLPGAGFVTRSTGMT